MLGREEGREREREGGREGEREREEGREGERERSSNSGCTYQQAAHNSQFASIEVGRTKIQTRCQWSLGRPVPTTAHWVLVELVGGVQLSCPLPRVGRHLLHQLVQNLGREGRQLAGVASYPGALNARLPGKLPLGHSIASLHTVETCTSCTRH